MCGIAGLVQPSGSDTGVVRLANGAVGSPLDAVARMVEHLCHRGPDGHGLESADGDRSSAVILGHTRLAILDLSSAGRQPMVSGDGALQITYNGEIYNYQELRDELGDEEWHSQSDTEVILHAYARWGRACVDHLRGMFAFAIWDARRRELFLARDRLGIKPLYYVANERFFLFASEVRALLASGLVPRRLEPAGLWEYLAYQSLPAPRTLIQGVRALPPGNWLAVDATGSVTQERYWDLLGHASPEAAVANPAESRRRVMELLRESVSLHLVSDVPVGAFLSGGIDSSAVVALMREAGQTPRTFSVGFDEQHYDETPHARQVAASVRTDHTEIRLRERDLLDQLPDALGAMDQPTGDGVNTFVIARAVRAAGVPVALSGLGGDELFAGYPSFRRLDRSARLFGAWARAPAPFRALAASTVRALGRSSVGASKIATMMTGDGSLATLFPVTRQVLAPFQCRELLEQSWIDAADGLPDPYAPLLREAFDASPHAETLARVSYAEARTYMHDVLLRDTDQMSMAHALEVRVPLLDHKLAEYVIGLPASHKQPGGTPKRLLVESLDGLLPEQIVRRPKQGFTLPFEPWMRGPLRQFCEARLGPDGLGGRGVFRPHQVQGLWMRFLAGRPGVAWSRLWVLVALEEWLERNGF